MMRDRPVLNGYGELVTKLRELVGDIYNGGCMISGLWEDCMHLQFETVK